MQPTENNPHHYRTGLKPSRQMAPTTEAFLSIIPNLATPNDDDSENKTWGNAQEGRGLTQHEG